MAEDSNDSAERFIPAWLAKVLKRGLRLLLTALVVALIAYEVDLWELGITLFRAHLGLVGLAVSLTALLNLVKPVRWLILVRAAVPETQYGTALKSLLVAAAGRLVLPSKIGEFARIFMVPKLRVSSGIGLTLIDILVEAQVALLWALPGLFVMGGTTAFSAGLVGTILVAVVTRAPHRCAHPIARLIKNDRLDQKLLSARDMMRRLGTRGWLRAIGVTIGISLFRFSQLFVLLWAVDADVSTQTLAYLPLIQLSDAVPLTVGGVGIREWVGLRILPRAGIAPGAAVGAVLLQSLITNILPGAIGFAFIRNAKEDVLSRLQKRSTSEHTDPLESESLERTDPAQPYD